MGEDVPSVRPPTSTQYGQYGTSLFMQGTRVRFGEGGENCFRPIEVGLSNRHTAEERSVFSDYTRITQKLEFALQSLSTMRWAVRITYQRTEPAGSEPRTRLYSNQDNELQPVVFPTPPPRNSDMMHDFILCEDVEQALTVVNEIAQLDLASELDDLVYPHESLSSPAPLDNDLLFKIVDQRTADY